MKSVSKLLGKEEKYINTIKEFVSELSKIFSLEEDRLPVPTNTKYVLHRLEEVLELARTNSLLFANYEIKVIALAYVLILLGHCLDYPTLTGFSIFDPQSLLWIASEKENKITLPYLAKYVKKSINDFEKALSNLS